MPSISHVVLGLIFLKYISDTFEEHRAKLLAGKGDNAGANPEDPDEYKAENVFWVPADARWSHLQASAKQPAIGKTVDDAMVDIERDNPRLKDVLPKNYARPGLANHRFGKLIDIIATISLTAASEGEKPHRSVDLLGRVYDWSGATKTAAGSPKGECWGVHQFYTPSCVVRCFVDSCRKDDDVSRENKYVPVASAPQTLIKGVENPRCLCCRRLRIEFSVRPLHPTAVKWKITQ